MSVLRSAAWSCVAAMALATGASGQLSADVSTLDLAYRDLDKLIALDLVDVVVVGQRPYTRMTFAGFVQQARRRLGDAVPSRGVAALERLETVFAGELRSLGAEDEFRRSYRWLERVELEMTGTRSPGRAVRTSLGAVDGVVNPLLGYRQGRELVHGTTTSLETVHIVSPARSLALVVHPRLQLSEGRRGTPNVNGVTVRQAYVGLSFGNLRIRVGRANKVWGQGRHAGLMISENARGFDMIEVSNQRPGLLPGFLRVLGPTKGSLFMATTAADRDRGFLNSYIVGYKVSTLPTRWLELGWSFMVEAGGRGAPQASFSKRLVDHFFFVDILVPSAETFFSNKISAFDFRARVAGARGLQLYGEVAFDDITPSDIHKWLVQDSGWLVGAYLPRLDENGNVDVSFEYHYAGVRLYRHSQFLSGLTFNRFFIGDALGTEGRSGYVEINWDVFTDLVLSLNLAYEGRSNDVYETTGPDRRRKVQSLPQERRYRAVGSWTYRPTRYPFSIKGLAGYERVNTFDFALGRNRHNAIAQLGVRWAVGR